MNSFEAVVYKQMVLPDIKLDNYTEKYIYNYEHIWEMLAPSLWNETQKLESWFRKLYFRANQLSGTPLDDFITSFNTLYNRKYSQTLDLSRKKGAFPVKSLEQVNRKFILAGFHSKMLPKNQIINIAGSTGNDGTYTVAQSRIVLSETEIVVSENIVDALADGSIIVDESDSDYLIRLEKLFHTNFYKFLSVRDNAREKGYLALNSLYKRSWVLFADLDDLLNLGRLYRVEVKTGESIEDYRKRILGMKFALAGGTSVETFRRYLKLVFALDFGYENFWENRQPLGGSSLQDRHSNSPLIMMTAKEALHNIAFWFEYDCDIDWDLVQTSIRDLLKIHVFADIFFYNDESAIKKIFEKYTTEVPTVYYIRDESTLCFNGYGTGAYGSSPFGGEFASLPNLPSYFCTERAKALDRVLIYFQNNINVDIETIEDCLNRDLGGHRYSVLIGDRDGYIQNYFTDTVTVDDLSTPIVIDSPTGFCRKTYSYLIKKLDERGFGDFEIRDKLWYTVNNVLISGTFSVIDGAMFDQTYPYSLPLRMGIPKAIYVILALGTQFSISISDLYDQLRGEKQLYYEIIIS